MILDGEDYTLKVGINVGIQPPPKAVGWNNMMPQRMLTISALPDKWSVALSLRFACKRHRKRLH
jgi:hypothetical protein